MAYVNEAAITGESAPVLKEPATDIRSSVTGGTQVVSDTLRIQISADPGETFLDRMIALVEGAVRQKTPNEIALSILLSGLTIVFLLAVATLEPFAIYAGTPVSTVIVIALLVCLIPTTIGGLLSAIGIAGMDRVTRFNVLAMSGRAVEAAGDVDVLLLDKTGTITFGNRLAAEIVPVGGATKLDCLIAARQSSLGDDTPEGRSIQALAEQLGAPSTNGLTPDAEVIPFHAETRMSAFARMATGTSRARPTPSSRRPPSMVSGPRARRRSRAHLARWRHTAGAADGQPHRRRDLSQRHRQAGDAAAVRRVPPHGHQDDHDHRGRDRVGAPIGLGRLVFHEYTCHGRTR